MASKMVVENITVATAKLKYGYDMMSKEIVVI
jgi:hypothetical protein